MHAISIIRDFVRPLGVRTILVAALIFAVVGAGPIQAGGHTDSKGPRVVASINIDSDGIVIRAEDDDDCDPECVDIYLDEDGIEAICGGELRCLKRAGIFDIDECDDDDIVRFGRNIRVRAGRKVKGDVVAIGGSVFIEGRVYGDVVAIGGSVVLDEGSRVKGDAVVVGGDLELLDGSYVRGDAVAIAGSIEDEDGSHVGGDIVSMEFSLW
jgi:hypothetical protein